MAKLMTCKDCGKEISKDAKTCPHCGKPQRKTSGCVWFLLLLLGLMLFGMLAGSGGKNAPAPQPTATQPPAIRPTATPDIRDGRTEAERRTIFEEVVRAEDQARQAAEKQLPGQDADQTEKRIALGDTLSETAREAVRTKHSLSVEQFKAIQIEGVTKGWMPSK